MRRVLGSLKGTPSYYGIITFKGDHGHHVSGQKAWQWWCISISSLIGSQWQKSCWLFRFWSSPTAADLLAPGIGIYWDNELHLLATYCRLSSDFNAQCHHCDDTLKVLKSLSCFPSWLVPTARLVRQRLIATAAKLWTLCNIFITW